MILGTPQVPCESQGVSCREFLRWTSRSWCGLAPSCEHAKNDKPNQVPFLPLCCDVPPDGNGRMIAMRHPEIPSSFCWSTVWVSCPPLLIRPIFWPEKHLPVTSYFQKVTNTVPVTSDPGASRNQFTSSRLASPQ